MKLSIQQQAVIDFIINGTGSANTIARAGCGKTTLLIEAVKAIVEHQLGSIFFGAYNKPIATEIQERLKALGIEWKQCNAGTFHSAGFGAVRKLFPGVKVEANKVRDLIENCINVADTDSDPVSYKDASRIESYQPFIIRAVSLAKQQAAGFLWPINDQSQWYNIVDHFGLDSDLDGWQTIDEAVSLSIRFLRKSIDQDKDIIDFDDMIFSPLYHNARLWPQDWVLIDEAQDTNPARRALALKMLKPKTGRLIAVGDPAQAIYGFTGADSNAMDLIQKELGSIELPLNQTYRCPKAIVEMAQQWVPDIEAMDEAPKGSINHVLLQNQQISTDEYSDDYPGFYDMVIDGNLHPQNDIILCRVVKPLIDLAFGLIRRGVGCQVEGREIGGGLLKIVNRFKAYNLEILVDTVDSWRNAQIQKWLAKGKEERAEQIDDQAETLIAVATNLLEEGKTTVQELRDFIDSIFGDTNGQERNVICLSTIHKSKGREWERVFILGMNKYMPSKWARKDWQQEQEANLCYVAVTRSKDQLVLIDV